ncbi:GNAT family N-acetyltransferase [Pseudoduganella plicata]|uniref:N-acetyltransferase family protein n=1 Tax=Pseudoduganella plicata TaxID=321984 RepID=A0A4V1ATC7_9BURK|nr:GNAT family N-acetyltransferase [Pseudoduganella plicata]QBQ35208.1 N-acetyltransferase family protein [Pseudoduganella plicata]GGZ05055.1 phosphinothricin acetyltransferase [Pseudoduganella plicata]
MSFRHRIASLDDLPTIVAIYNSTIASREVTADTEPVSVESRLNWFHEHQPEKRPLWVIERADDTSASPEILGWISYSNFYGRPAYSGTAEVSIYIAEQWRGKGIGRYALTQAIAHAPRIAVHTVLGFIFGHNNASLALFRQFGFEEWANFPRVANLDGVERDLIILGKRVG